MKATQSESVPSDDAGRAELLPVLAEVFREYGYEGASLARLSAVTGMGKGSLYHFFPGGKEAMAAAVLAHVDAWFERAVFLVLRESDPHVAIDRMWESVDHYFRSGRRICLVGAFALDDTRDRFAVTIRSYFLRWIEALAGALVRTGRPASLASADAEEIVAGIQGALTLARAMGDGGFFVRACVRMRHRLMAAQG